MLTKHDSFDSHSGLNKSGSALFFSARKRLLLFKIYKSKTILYLNPAKRVLDLTDPDDLFFA